MKKIFFLLTVIFTIGFTNVEANTIYNIDVDVDILENGNANITETWKAKGTNGTEWYHPFRDLTKDGYRLTNFTVSMDGKPLTYKIWNVNESIRSKAGYYGINYEGRDTELCFGKSDFNEHTFVLKYTIENYIYNVDDAQVMYWTFFPKFQNVNFKNFSVNIKSYYEFPETLDVWGYGYKGYAYSKDGIVSLSNSEDSNLNGNYVVALIKFPVNTFNTTAKSRTFTTFKQILSAANEGTTKYDYGTSSNSTKSKTSIWQKIINFITTFFWFIIMIPVGIFGGMAASKNGYGYKNNRKIDKNTVPNFRDIPCHKDIYYANALITLNNFDYRETNILGAIILKWVKQEKIGFIKQDVGIFKREQNCLDLRNKPTFDPGSREEELYNIMLEASGDGILEPREFGKWAKRNYDSFFNIFKGIKNDEINKLKSQGHIYPRVNKEECKKKNVMDDVIYEDSVQLYGLKKFLLEFSSIDTKEVIEVHLWDEYLMFAYLFGIADRVAKQLKNLYPELMEQQNYDYTTIMMINSFSATTVQAASSARSAAEHYSSGGGGFSVGGGGFGAGGGGGFSGGGSR